MLDKEKCNFKYLLPYMFIISHISAKYHIFDNIFMHEIIYHLRNEKYRIP